MMMAQKTSVQFARTAKIERINKYKTWRTLQNGYLAKKDPLPVDPQSFHRQHAGRDRKAESPDRGGRAEDRRADRPAERQAAPQGLRRHPPRLVTFFVRSRK